MIKNGMRAFCQLNSSWWDWEFRSHRPERWRIYELRLAEGKLSLVLRKIRQQARVTIAEEDFVALGAARWEVWVETKQDCLSACLGSRKYLEF